MGDYALNLDWRGFRVVSSAELAIYPTSQWPTVGGVSLGDAHYASEEEVAAALLGRHLDIEHVGGPLGMWLALADFSDVTAGAQNPTFGLSLLIDNSPVDTHPPITVNVLAQEMAYWDNMADLPPGTYRVTYLGGAFSRAALDPLPWSVSGDGVAMEIVSNLKPPSLGTLVNYTDQAAVEAANNPNVIAFSHTAGPIGIWLAAASYTAHLDSCQNPTFRLVSNNGTDYGVLTPDIHSNNIAWWSERASFGNGSFRLEYEGGAFSVGDASQWGIHFTGAKFYVFTNAPSSVAPGANATYSSQAELEGGNAGAFVDIVHTGGPIGMWLDALSYANNIIGTSAPTFRLTSPDGDDLGLVTPSVKSNDLSWWASRAALPAGTYQVTFVGGGMRYAGSPLWTIRQTGVAVYKVLYDAPYTQAPGKTQAYATPAAAESDNIGAHVDIDHPGGPLGMYLFDKESLNHIAGAPNPTFKLKRI